MDRIILEVLKQGLTWSNAARDRDCLNSVVGNQTVHTPGPAGKCILSNLEPAIACGRSGVSRISNILLSAMKAIAHLPTPLSVKAFDTFFM